MQSRPRSANAAAAASVSSPTRCLSSRTAQVESPVRRLTASSPSPSAAGGGSSASRRRTAFTKPRSLGPTSPTVSPTAACAGTEVYAIWYAPNRIAFLAPGVIRAMGLLERASIA